VIVPGLPVQVEQLGRQTAAEVRPQGALDLVEPPIDFYLVNMRSGLAQGLGGRPGSGTDLEVDRKVPGCIGERDTQSAQVLCIRGAQRARRREPQRRRVARVRSGHDVLQHSAVGNGPSHRAVVEERISPGRREDRVAPVRRLEGDDPRERCRRAQRPTDVRPGGQSGGPRGQAGGRAAGRPAGRSRQVPRVAGYAANGGCGKAACSRTRRSLCARARCPRRLECG